MDPALAALYARYDGPVPALLLAAVRAGSAAAHERERTRAAGRLFDRLARGVVASLAHHREKNAPTSPRMTELAGDLAFYREWGVRTMDALK